MVKVFEYDKDDDENPLHLDAAGNPIAQTPEELIGKARDGARLVAMQEELDSTKRRQVAMVVEGAALMQLGLGLDTASWKTKTEQEQAGLVWGLFGVVLV